ncbi:hypothetical protein VB735_30900 [Halotia wernerae UHCC 0503]|nr:hypothetical protein [Halotia wernerae UHCC 0503]
MSLNFAKGRWTGLPLWEMLLLLSCLGIEVASVTLPAAVYHVTVVRRLIKATFYRVGQAINPGGSAGVCQRLVLWVELVRTAATSIYRGRCYLIPPLTLRF